MTDLQEVIEYIALNAKEKKYAEFPLILQKWRTLKEIIRILQIPYKATIELQKHDLALSDVYGIWLEMKLHLEKIISSKIINSGFDKIMLNELESKYDDIFNHPAMKAAIFLDPRFRQKFIQKDDDVYDAKEFIIEIQQRLNYFKNRNRPANDIANDVNEFSDDSNDSIGIIFDAQSAISSYLGHNNQNSQNVGHQNITLGRSDIEAALDLFNPPVLPIKESVLTFWGKQDDEYDELREIAAVIYAIPPTEAHVERDFSALKFILSDRRGSLSNEKLENILCLYLNKELYLGVNEKQIEKLVESL